MTDGHTLEVEYGDDISMQRLIELVRRVRVSQGREPSTDCRIDWFGRIVTIGGVGAGDRMRAEECVRRCAEEWDVMLNARWYR